MYLLIVFLLFFAAAPDQYAPLTLYNGTWAVTRKDGGKADTMTNQCSKVGHFYACDQSVNSTPGALLVFIPIPNKPGRYYTQNIRPEGRATSRGDLEINGNQWIFLSNWDQGGRTTYYRTINTFTTHNHIHFEQSESDNNRDWTVTASGEEVRTTAHR